jgi:DUF1680 family protein
MLARPGGGFRVILLALAGLSWETIGDGGGVALLGQLDWRLRAAAARVAADPVFDETFVLQDLAHVPGYRRQFEEWAGDLSGRYIGALAACAPYTGEEYPRLHAVARAIPHLQRPTGLVGSDLEIDTVNFPVIWGQGRLLAGLLEYHAAFPTSEVLECARRLGDFYVRSEHTWSSAEARDHHDFHYYTQAIEGLVALHHATREEAYLATARRIGRMSQQSIGDVADQHSHAYLLTLLGLLDLYEAGGDAGFLESVQAAWAEISGNMSLVDGAPPEFFPWSDRNEGCSIADWLDLNLRLGRLTGKADYFETAERVWRNALYANQAANGGFCHRHFSAGRRGYTGEGSEAWWCCSFHGLRVLSRIPRNIYAWHDDAVRVHFIESSRVDVPLSRGNVRIVQETSYPGGGETTLHILEAPAGGVRLEVRCPGWAIVEDVRLNGAETSYVIDEGYVRGSAQLRAGDTLTITLRMGLRVESGNTELGSLWWGPLLMTCEIPGGTACAVAVPPADQAGVFQLPPLNPPDHPFALSGTHFAVIGTGNPVALPVESIAINQPQLGRLRPLADQTGWAAPPPAMLRLPIIEAKGPVLAAELARLLGLTRST